jgi:hypothetical protein
MTDTLSSMSRSLLTTRSITSLRSITSRSSTTVRNFCYELLTAYTDFVHQRVVKGCPKEWMMLMTEVFDAWAAESVQKQPLPFAQSYMQPDPYAQQQLYPQAQPYMQGQPYPQVQPQPYQQVQAAYNYNYNSPVQQPATPYSPPGYPSPISQNAVPNDAYTYRPPQAVEMPAELPGGTLLAAPVSVPMRSTSTDVSSSSFALLARDLWSADSNIEEEKVVV